MDFEALKNKVATTPAFVIDEDELTDSLKRLDGLRRLSGVKVLYSIKSLPMDIVLNIAKPFIDGFSASSLFEAKLANEVLAGTGSIHLTTPGIKPDEIDCLTALCTHVSFNSMPQMQRYVNNVRDRISVGIRVNPKLSLLADDRFDPCRPHSKLGIDIGLLSQGIDLSGVKGLHVHTNFSATDFTPLLKTVEKMKSSLFAHMPQLEWLNLGGGYLYDCIENHRPFIDLVQTLMNDLSVEVYVEPGKAVIGRSGHFVATVIDVFDSDSKNIAILDTSVNHNPEVFEFQRIPDLYEHFPEGTYPMILAGSTCLAGDIFGEYRFEKALCVGDKVVFKHTGAYSLVKANRFNGYNLPDIYAVHNGGIRQLKRYRYEEFRSQWQSEV